MSWTRCVLACAVAASAISMSSIADGAGAGEAFIPAKGLVVQGRAVPTDAETLAVNRFAEEFARFTGARPTIVWGERPTAHEPRLIVGNRATLASLFKRHNWDGLVRSKDADLRGQSYVIEAVEDSGSPAPSITVAGYGEQDTPRGSLGMSYGLAELLRRLDVRADVWGFALPIKPLVGTPATPHRTLYTAKFIDETVDAGYDRMVLGSAFPSSMYSGDNAEELAGVMRDHQEQRRLIELARRRGLEVCQYILPPFVRPEILRQHLDLQGEGFYNQKPGHGGLCWSKPQGREMIRRFTREKMEYFGPVDVYSVWFYDPGGCFCKDCKANQAKNIYDQLMLVTELAKSISPNARIEAVLWPTWCFHEYQTRGIPFTDEETRTFVRDFLARSAEKFGPGKLTIVDTCESDVSNIYNGLVDPKVFQRDGFMYSAMGMPGELAYRFPPFKFKYLNDQMGLARSRGVETATLYTAGWLTPSIYAFADDLYHRNTDWRVAVRNYARTVAKGECYQPYVDLLLTLEDAAGKTRYDEIDASLKRAEALWKTVDASPHFYGDHGWLKGYMIAQRHYLEMARATDEQTFAKWFSDYKRELGTIPEFQGYAAALSPELIVNAHLTNYWRGPAGDKSTVGLGVKAVAPNSAKVDPRTGDKVVQ